MKRRHWNKNGVVSQRQQIFLFVEENPGCTTQAVKDRFGMEGNQASMALSRLRREGVIAGRKMDDSKMWEWVAIEKDEEDGKDRAPFKHILTSTWTDKPNRCPLVAALFGEAA